MSWTISNLLKVGAKPIWLYRFRIGGQVFFYTSRSHAFWTVANKPLPVGKNWLPRTIKAPDLKRSVSKSKQQVKIGLPRTDEVSKLFQKDLGMLRVEVTIWHGFENDSDEEFVLMFFGNVVKVQPSMLTTTLVCADEFTTLEDGGLSKMIQRNCDYTVFHGGCGLNIVDFQVAGNVTVIGSAALTIPVAGAKPAKYFNGGSIELNGSRQYIRQHNGELIYLMGTLPGLQEEFDLNGIVPVILAPGCNKSIQECRLKFNNTLNYGGFPWMTDNPYDGKRIM